MNCTTKPWHICKCVFWFSVLTCTCTLGIPIPTVSADENANVKEDPAVNELAINLRLPYRLPRTHQRLSAKIVLTNRGNSELFIPLMKGELATIFFEFLFIGDEGTMAITDHAQTWNDPFDYKVDMIRLAPGASHTVILDNFGRGRTNLGFSASSDSSTISDLIEKSADRSFELVAIYRDHSWAHDAADEVPADQKHRIWRGPATSAPVRVRVGEAEDDEADKKRRMEQQRDANQLCVELRLARTQIVATDPINSEILFLNRGKKAIYIPIAEGQEALGFIDFLLFQTVGGDSRLTNNAQRSSGRLRQGVKMVRLEPGGTYRVLLRPALLFREYFNPLFLSDNSSFDIVAIYRDHCWAHTAANDVPDKDEKLVWKGSVLSSAEHLKIVDKR